jgi:GNAT superfamily N-acetyltransferase
MHRVREARVEDAGAAVELVRASIEQLCIADHRNDPDTLARWLANKTPQSFRTWLANPENYCVVATEGKELLGVGLLRRDGELVLFYLRPGTQRRGIGTSIYRVLEQQASNWGLRTLHLGSTLMAQSFYRAQGFRPTGPAQSVFGTLLAYPHEKTLV